MQSFFYGITTNFVEDRTLPTNSGFTQFKSWSGQWSSPLSPGKCQHSSWEWPKMHPYKSLTLHASGNSLQSMLHHYLQWCFRLPSQNSVSQPMQRFTAWSGIHSVGPASRSSTASHDTSEWRDSPAEGCSPLHTDSGRDPFCTVQSNMSDKWACQPTMKISVLPVALYNTETKKYRAV